MNKGNAKEVAKKSVKRKPAKKAEIVLADGGPVIEWCEAIRHGYASGRVSGVEDAKKF